MIGMFCIPLADMRVETMSLERQRLHTGEAVLLSEGVFGG